MNLIFGNGDQKKKKIFNILSLLIISNFKGITYKY